MKNNPLSYSADHAKAITKSDTAMLAQGTSFIWVGGAGNMRVKTRGGQTVTLDGIPAGTLLPIHVAQVLSLSTTATNLVALW
jgi:hypothetical protein